MTYLHTLHSPLFWLLAMSLSIWLYTVLTSDRSKWGTGRWVLAGLYLFGWLLAYVVSTPLGSGLLVRSLVIESDIDPDFQPEYILVAAMGYVFTGDPESDVLNDGTASRVATAARWWKQFPEVTLVMQGYSGGGSISEDHQGNLMKHFAMSFGIPFEKILLEPQSRNTREHVENILGFDRITAETRIGVVSSDWHLRRVRMVFDQEFPNVRFLGAPGRKVDVTRATLLIPDERNLVLSAICLREWAAVAWYSLKGWG
jgi:uncharacterized SAM-binding protein YcdF (DUF218 family)